jgi:BirA family biotin operon repressor/biotin-[acetyl-CoA-carboxylase] ligase
MLTEHTVAAAAAAAGLLAPVHFVEVTGSTNTDLWTMAKGGAPEWTLVVAGRQEAGRGRLGRTWVSAPGASLHVSLLLRPRLGPLDAPLLSLAAAVAMAIACRHAGRIDVGCKWPNDLIAGNRKLGGVLTEASVRGTRLEFVIIGAGANVSQRAEDFPEGLRDTATSVAREGGANDASGILEGYLKKLHDLYGDGGQAIGSRVLEPYRRSCRTIGRRVRAITLGGHEVDGVARGIGDRGELIVQTETGSERVGFGEIRHLEV